ncbi:MAG: arsenate reductase (azurin) small subunit [Chloroflexota bacterium]
MNEKLCEASPESLRSGLVSRRQFLKLGGAAVVMLTLPAYLRKVGLPARLAAQRAEYPRQVIGQLSALPVGQPISFRYPWEHPAATNFLIKLDERAAGGVGPEQNVVAFNIYCTHQGSSLAEEFHAETGIAGPCRLHWMTFDLTRHGMVISGHATQGLPQIVLETEGDDIIATGVQGLIYGYYDNLAQPG